jgi:toxin ParE1/3/4
MPRLLKRPEVYTDLEEIWWYIAQDSPANADQLLDQIQEKSLLIANFPNMGENRDELLRGLRSFPVGRYLVFYFPLPDGIDIVRVFHGSRDLESLFS